MAMATLSSTISDWSKQIELVPGIETILSRLLYYLSIWFSIATASFVLFHLVPSDPVRTMLGPNASETQVETVRRELGLDRPIHRQFRHYIQQVAILDFGNSYVDGRPVGTELGKRFRVSLSLAAVSLLIIFSYLALLTVLARMGIGSGLSELSDFLCVSLPTLFAGFVIALASAKYYPYTRFSGAMGGFSDWLFLVPPAFVLALYPMGILGRILRKQFSELRRSRYVLSAQALGLSKSVVWRRYILRNAYVPMLAAFGNQIPFLVSSTFIVELIFSVPGIGVLLLRSVLERDLPMMEGIVISTSIVVLIVSGVLEILYPKADPRIRVNGNV